jgi:hypothetical protein
MRMVECDSEGDFSMKMQMVLTVEKDDNVRLRDIAEAFNLVGGISNDDKKTMLNKRSGELTEREREDKVFGKIATGQFTLEDAQKAVAVVLCRAQEIVERSKEPIFEDEKRQQVWREGIISNAQLAVRQAQQFMMDLSEDMQSIRA